MIRVLHVLNSMNMGGIQTTLINIFRKIDREKVVFDFLVETGVDCDYSEEIKKLGGKIFSVTPRRKSIIQNRKDLNKFFKEHKEYKIVHMHVSSLSYITPLIYAKKYKVPVRIIHSRNTKEGGSFLHNILHNMNKLRLNGLADYYFACSGLAGEWLYNKKILNSDKYRIINNGIDTNKFKFNPEVRNKMRKELDCEKNIALICVGRLHPQKNHFFLLDVFNEFKKINKNAKLYLLGDGALRDKIEEKIDNLGLNDSVILLGMRKNVNEISWAMDAFVMPSFYEGLPGSVVEAQGSGLPCIISDRITREVKLTDLVEYVSIDESPEVWAKIIDKKIKSVKRKDMSGELIDKGFDMNTIAKKMAEFYEGVLKK